MKCPPYSYERLIGLADGRLDEGSLLLFDSIDSTNRMAREIAADGKMLALVVADRQSEGRGQGGRSWYSPAGMGIWASIVLRPNLSPEKLGLIPIASGLAISEVVERLQRVRIGVKWPNDLVCSGRKLGGILVESSTLGDRVSWAVVGVGINIFLAEDGFPAALMGRATSLRLEGVRNCDREELLVSILTAVVDGVTRLDTRPTEELVEAFAKRDALRGRRVIIEESPGRRHEGEARGIDPTGALLVDTLDGLTAVRSGTVVWFAP